LHRFGGPQRCRKIWAHTHTAVFGMAYKFDTGGVVAMY